MIPLKGIGIVELQIISKNSISNLVISDFLFVPEFSENLISIWKLSKKGYSEIFEKDICKINFDQANW